MGLIVGLDAATATRGTVLGSLLIARLADNLTDSLSIHMYQESKKLPEREALRTTTVNFAVRLSLSLSFVLLLGLLPRAIAVRLSVLWGFVLRALVKAKTGRER